jgi:dATP pyrophosphohydrolase
VFVGFIDTEQQVRLSHEHNEYRWITVDEADDFLAFQQQKEMLKTIASLFGERNPNPVLEIKE